jgi:ABC-2 type transport system ATP-binding protein
MKQKLALCCALISQPQILLLDEPTTGVDPVSRREFWDVLAAIASEGVTIVVATPYLDEAEPFPCREGGTNLPSPRRGGVGGEVSSIAIGAKNLRKVFGDFQAVKGVDLEIRYGDIYGLLGANGAGKTTTIKMLCGLLEPSSGTMSLAGQTHNLRSSAL